MLIAVSEIVTEPASRYIPVLIPLKSELLTVIVPELVEVVKTPYVGVVPRVPSTSSPDIETVFVPAVRTPIAESSMSIPSIDTSAPPSISTATAASLICEFVSVVVVPESAFTPLVLAVEVYESMVSVPSVFMIPVSMLETVNPSPVIWPPLTISTPDP